MNRIRDDNQHHHRHNPPIQYNYNAAIYSQAAGVYNNTMPTPMIYPHIDTQLGTNTNSNQERRTVSVGSGGNSVINQGGSLGVNQQVLNGMSPVHQGNFVNGSCDGTASSTLTTEDRSFGTTNAYAQGVPTSLVPDNVSLPCGGARSGTSVMETTGMNEASGYAQALPVNQGYLQDMPQIQGQNHVVPGTAVNNGHPVSHFVVLLFILVLLLIYMNT